MFRRLFSDPFHNDDFFSPNYSSFDDVFHGLGWGRRQDSLNQGQAAIENPNNNKGSQSQNQSSSRHTHHNSHHQHNYNRDDGASIMPFGFPSFGRSFQNAFDAIEKSVADTSNNSDGYSFKSSSVYSYHSDGADGSKPKIYQAHKTVRTGPGGMREERRAEHDSERNYEKMAIGRHIGDKGRSVERHRDLSNNEEKEMRNYYQLNEKESDSFDREWNDRSKQMRMFGLGDNRRSGFREIEHAFSGNSSAQNAIKGGESNKEKS